MKTILKTVLNLSIFRIHFLCFIFFVWGCSVQEQKSLLTSGATCAADGTCPQNTVTDLTGQPSLSPDVGETTMNIETSDLLEITGSCSDLGRKDNRIVVKVYSSELDTSSPYIDNSISANCQTNTVNLLTTYQCLFVTHGHGLQDTGKTYPQCINGRFGFKVRLGSVSKSSGILQKYSVRMQLLTFTPAAQSAPVTTVVNRDLSAPNFRVKPDFAYFDGTAVQGKNQCSIRIEPYKFKTAVSAADNVPIITYAIKRQAIGYDTNGAQNPAVIPATPPDRLGTLAGFYPFDATRIDVGDSIANFIDGDMTAVYSVLSPTTAEPLQPGVKYIYSVQAQSGIDQSIISTTQTCEIPTPLIYTYQGASLGNCYFRLSRGISNYVTYEWRTSTSAAVAASPAGALMSCASAGDCTFDKLVDGVTNYVAVRTVSGGLYSKWSNVLACD